MKKFGFQNRTWRAKYMLQPFFKDKVPKNVKTIISYYNYAHFTFLNVEL